MVNLKEFAASFKGKKELSDLDKISVEDLQVQSGEFEKNGKMCKYNYIHIEDWDYSINADIMSQIKTVMAQRPLTKHIQVRKAPNGSLYVVSLD